MAAAAPNIDEPQRADQLRRRANRRLLGASVLLLIAIVAVPMFLEREPPPLPDNVDVRIPPVEGTKFDPKFPDGKKAAADKPAEIASISEPTGAQAGVPASAAPSAAPITPVAPAAAVASAVPDKAPASPAKATAEPSSTKPAAPAASANTKSAEKPAEKAAIKATEKAPAKAAPAASAEPVRKPGQLVVQVIAVRDPAAAKQAYDRAKSLKFPVYTEKIDVSNGTVTRVRVGPYDGKQAAESARARLAQAGFEAKVVTLQ